MLKIKNRPTLTVVQRETLETITLGKQTCNMKESLHPQH